MHGATNASDSSDYETPPPPPGSIQSETILHHAKERQEQYRLRVAVPNAATGQVAPAAGANLGYTGKTSGAASARSETASSGLLEKLFYAAASVVGLILFFQKIAPQIFAGLKERLHPWELTPAAGGKFPAKTRAEDESFTKFLTAFRAGPAAAPRPDTLESADPIMEFYLKAKKILGTQRTLLQDLGQAANDPALQKALMDSRFAMGELRTAAGFPEALNVWQVASTLEGLFKHCAEKIGSFTPSTLRSVAGGVGLLDKLCVPGLKPELVADRPLKFLVVDDDLISRQALSLALKKAFSQPDLAVDGETALALIHQQAYDVIFLDVQMPDMDGFELCTKIRETVLNRTTPVVFVTGLKDFDARAQSLLSGGIDLMGKPFLTFEVTVKALTFALQGRLQGRIIKPVQKIEQSQGVAATPEAEKKATLAVANPTVAARPSPAMSTPPKPDKLVSEILNRASIHLGPLRELCGKILQAPDEESRQALLADAFLRINSLAAQPGSGVVHPACHMSGALEGLLRKLLENPKYSTASALATVASAVDLLHELCVPGLPADLAINPPIHMLVVDDDLVSRRALVGALQTAFEKPENVADGAAALARAAKKPFDVIFLDVVMPGMNGFEVCKKIRDTEINRATPVVFVTGHADFNIRTQMSSSGGNELLAKPFFTAEITVKALAFALRGRLEQAKAQPVA